LRPIDVAVIRASRVPDMYGLLGTRPPAASAPAPLPPDVDAELATTNPRLRELQDRYAALDRHPAVRHSLWNSSFVQQIALRTFRLDSAYLLQKPRTLADIALFLLGGYYVKSVDALGLFETLEEDGLFGAFTQRLSGRYTISKDLLDSINELN